MRPDQSSETANNLHDVVITCKGGQTMTEDVIDTAILAASTAPRKLPSIDALTSEMPDHERLKPRSSSRAFKRLFNKLRLRRCATAHISEPDPSFKVAYLGNVVTGWAKGDGCVEKPLATLWRNYTQSSRPDVRMQLTVSGGGLRATTRDHGLTEYWAHRLTTCAAPAHFPRLFCWVYRHEGRRLRHELRCHAVLCSSAAIAVQIEEKLKDSLSLALNEFKREKISKQNARLSLVNSVYDNPTIPRRKILLSTGCTNYRPPLERSKSAPKLTSIEENLEETEEIFEGRSRSKPIPCSHRQTAKLCEDVLEGEVEDEEDEDPDSLLMNILTSGNLSDEILKSLPSFDKSDEDVGSMSSGCESASTVVSENDGQQQAEVAAAEEHAVMAIKKTELDFKVGQVVLQRMKHFDSKCNGMKSNGILDGDEVSLIPVGETQPDFSSLKVFKKRCIADHAERNAPQDDGSEEENGSACSDESGYDDLIDSASSVGGIVLV